ncbi:MAG: FAD:protein FMN transferase, partial [Deltaproteobacteria bacterium]|nr:FAD:protein FMN transferase [Deltaproteobacteria bacterium]
DLAKVVYVTLRTFEGVEALASAWRASSALSRLNQAAGRGPYVVPDALWDLLSRGVDLGALTSGAFDMSWAVLGPLWDFRRGVVPSAAAVRQARRRIDYRRITLSGRPGQRAVTLPAHMAIGLGGIAKGFALDEAAKALAAAGLRSYSISAGGQVLVAGGRGHRAWRVGIRDPIHGAKSFFAVATMRVGSCATSGDYERVFDRDGKHYHHILDPRTGRPTWGLHSVTVIDRDATRADALATALMVMGRRRGLGLVARLPRVEALFVDAAGQVYQSAGAKAVLHILRAPRLPKGSRRSR